MRLAANARVAGVSGRPCDTSCAASAEACDAFLPAERGGVGKRRGRDGTGRRSEVVSHVERHAAGNE